MSSEVETSREISSGLCQRDSSTSLGMTVLITFRMFQRILIAVLVMLACMQIARADSPSVTAVLSNSEATVGETVELQIKVTGPGDARPPEEISVDGLEIHSTGTSRQSVSAVLHNQIERIRNWPRDDLPGGPVA